MKASRPIVFATLFSLTVSLFSCSQPNSPDSAMSAPMTAMLKAAKNSDVKMFKEAYSKRIREDDGQSDWGKNLKEAQATSKEKFGDYQLSDFTFSFEGDDRKGKLAVSFKNNKQVELAIVKEDGTWRLDER